MVGSGFIALVVAGGVLAATAGSESPAAAGPPDAPRSAGLAGPLGPDAFSAVATYYKQVTFTQDQLGQFQDITMSLPAGRYRVDVITSEGPSSSRPDCAGVAFPLVPSVVAGSFSFTGYVPVANDGDAATVSCYERATGHANATYRLFYLPVGPKSGAAPAKEHS